MLPVALGKALGARRHREPETTFSSEVAVPQGLCRSVSPGCWKLSWRCHPPFACFSPSIGSVVNFPAEQRLQSSSGRIGKRPVCYESDTVSSDQFSLGEVGGPYIDSQQLPGPKTLTHSLSRVLLLPSRRLSQFKSFEYKGFGVSFVQQKLGKQGD